MKALVRHRPRRDYRQSGRLLLLAGVWAGVVIGLARMNHPGSAWLIAVIALAPGAILWTLAILDD